ncbi:hypothetical protein KIN20_003644 [Parelaphostrongylus tenuis]|uniref:Globin family profile domain-containing protein n=1 Tax=Parelaphostrongylus tenuis TaxID=148309 RepID=A0AAD5QHI2_PARTN|nr:hypothetical protein KIN20_003644 [Parelaphostrongylus tenuis]
MTSSTATLTFMAHFLPQPDSLNFVNGGSISSQYCVMRFAKMSSSLANLSMWSNKAHRIQNFLDTAVGSLGFCPISSIYDMAHRIGQIHFYRGVNFGADNWLVFKRITVDQVTCQAMNFANIEIEVTNNTDDKQVVIPDIMSQYSGENCLARLGWNKLMTVIVREMKRGFLEEAMRNCKEEDNNDMLGA